MIKAVPYLMENKIQNYDWGTKGAEAVIPKLLNIPVEENMPYAELWMGAHKKASSKLIFDNSLHSLLGLIEKYPKDILGNFVIENFQNNFPFLLKILSAAETLSIQVHPTKEQAKKLHKKDPANYPDENHKPEIAIALTNLDALIGFKNINEIILLLEEYPEIIKLADNIGQYDIGHKLNFNKIQENDFIEKLYSGILTSSISNKKLMIDVLKSISEKISNKHNKTESEILFETLSKKYKSDVGLFSVLLLNLVHLKKDEAVFLDAGIPHAYIRGDIIECMANSDNVIRAGLTPKFKDVEALKEMVNYSPSEIDWIKPVLNGSQKIYKSKVEEFQIAVLDLSEGNSIEINSNKRPEILFILEGNVKFEPIKSGNFELTAYKGNSVFIPAVLNGFKIEAVENSKIVRAFVPVS